VCVCVYQHGVRKNNCCTHLYIHLQALKERILCKAFGFEFKPGGREYITRRTNARDFEWKNPLCPIPLQILSVLQLCVLCLFVSLL